MASLGSIMAKLELNIDNFAANMKLAEQRIKKIDDQFSGFTDIGSRFTDVGKKFTLGVTTPVAALGTVITKTSATFQQGMSEVKAISGATAEQMDQLKEKAKEMGAKTKFSAKESADAFKYMAMAGWDTEAMLNGIEGIMDLAAASGEDLAMTSDIVTDALTAFGLKAQDSGHFADVLASASSAANTNVAMLGESFKYVAPVAGALGMSAEDTSIALGLMANSGIKAGQAGTSLRASLTNLAKPTDAMAALMDKYNISLTNSDGSIKSLKQLMDDLRLKMGGMDKATQASAAATLFGKEAMSGMLAIINASDEDYQKLTDSIYNCDGVAKQQASTMQDNLAGAWEELTGALETIAITMGDILIPIMTNVVKKLQVWVDKFASLSEGTQKTILVIAGIGAAIGPTILIIGKMITVVGQAIRIFKLMKGAIAAVRSMHLLAAASAKIMAIAQGALNLVMSANPITIVILAIVALVGVFVLLWNKCEGFREFFIKLWDNMKIAAAAFWEWLKEAPGQAIEFIKEKWAMFVDWMKMLWDGLKLWFAELWAGIQEIFWLAVDGVVQFVTENWGYLFDNIKGIFDGIMLYIQGIWEIIKNVFLGAILIIIDIVTGNWTQLGSDISNLWNNIKAGMAMVWDGIKLIFGNAIQATWEIITTIWTNVTNWISQTWNNITTFLSNTWTNIKTSISNAWTGFWNTISTWCTNIYNTILQWFNNAINWLKALPGNLMNIGAKMFSSMKQGVSSTISGVYTAIVNGINNAIKWITALPSQAITWGKDIIKGFIKGIKNTVGEIGDAAKGVADKIRSFLHFTRPDEGPLRNYETWMPDMIEGLTRTLNDKRHILTGAARGLAGDLNGALTSQLSASIDSNVATVAYSSNDLLGAIKQLTQIVQDKSFDASLQIDGRTFAETTSPYMSQALAERTRW